MARNLALFLLLLLSGCVSSPTRETESPTRPAPATVTPPSQPERRIYSRPDSASPPAYHGRSHGDTGGGHPPAVLALLTEAERQLGAGQADGAAATLERAIRIKPKSAELWSKLARVRMQQSRFDQAEQLAKKSNVLARGERALTARNWSIIAESRRLRGDRQGAEDAQRRAGS